MIEFTAWTIDTNSIEGHRFLGRYFFLKGEKIPPSSEGCRVALFKTRKLARLYHKEGLKNYTPSSWKPRVIKVSVLIKEVK